MTLQQILDRYTGYGLVVYGGEKVFVDSLSNVIGWYLDGVNMVESENIPSQILQVVVTTNGYLDGVRVETTALSYLESVDGIIYHGYPEFRTEGIEVIKEVYAGGCLVTKMIGEVYRLRKVASLIPDSPPISTPFRYDPKMEKLLPYTHIYSRLEQIKKEGVLKMPLREVPDGIPNKELAVLHSTSSYVDKERKLLIAAIDLAIRANTKDFILLYYGDLYIKWVPHFLSLFGYLTPTIHLWGKDQGVVIPSSRSILIRPQDMGEGDKPSIEKYVERYGRDNKILIVADEDGTSLLDIDPLYAYLPYEKVGSDNDDSMTSHNHGIVIRGKVVVLPWSTLGRANVLFTRGDRETVSQITKTNLNYFHSYDRMDSYNLGAILQRELGTDSGRSIPMPNLGLCTCYDCAREVETMSKYMKARNIPYSHRTLEGLVTSNGPSLWPLSLPISRPEDRTDLILTSDTIDQLLHLDIYAYNNIAINTSLNHLIPYIGGETYTPMERMKRVLNGETWPIVVNFHKLVRNYDPSRDKGRVGARIYNQFLQSVAINKSSLDVIGLLTLFILSR